ncbi:MAG: exodeoxyribonuclease VII small subunit [Deltaproteobacteria bacterium]|nr:exodeoxyribonuclease VII small subunit [Deltaproteobacteria bacterium]
MAEKKFEKALEELEEIVKRMEEGNMSLEESLKAFGEGIKISRFCADKLDKAERKVEVLLREEDALNIRTFEGKDGGKPENVA